MLSRKFSNLPRLIRKAYLAFLVRIDYLNFGADRFSIRFVASLFRTIGRRWKTSLAGIVLAGTLASSAYWYFRQSPSKLAEQIRLKATNAYKSGQFLIAITRLQELNGQTPLTDEDRWLLYQAYRDKGDSDLANEQLRALAPDSRVGFALAHRERAHQLITSINLRADRFKSLQLRPQDANQLSLHLTGCENPTDNSLQLAFAFDAFTKRRYADAVTHMNRLVDREPDLLEPMAEAYRALKQTDLANAFDEKNIVYQSSRLQVPEVAFDAHCSLARSALSLKKFDLGLKTLEAGWNTSHDRRYPTLLANYRVSQFDALVSDISQSKDALSDLLKSALHYDSSHLPTIERLLDLGLRDESHHQTVKQLFTEFKSSPDSSAMILFGLASLAWQHDDKTESLKILEQAHRADPTNPLIANNLAMALGELDPNRWEEALILASDAVRRAPAALAFSDTVGLLQWKLKRPEQAIVTWEKILAQGYRTPDVLRQLATAYRLLGDVDTAATYERGLDSLKKNSPRREEEQ